MSAICQLGRVAQTQEKNELHLHFRLVRKYVGDEEKNCVHAFFPFITNRYEPTKKNGNMESNSKLERKKRKTNFLKHQCSVRTIFFD